MRKGGSERGLAGRRRRLRAIDFAHGAQGVRVISRMRNENARAAGSDGVKVAPGWWCELERGSLGTGEFLLMPRFCRAGATALVGLAAVALAGCASTPQVASRHSKEYFPSSVYGAASPRVVADGQPVPRGGGQYLVGHPYTIAGRTYYPREDDNYVAVGIASWYGDAFHGRRPPTAKSTIKGRCQRRIRPCLCRAMPASPISATASRLSCASTTAAPYAAGRVMDVSSRVADVLDFKRMGTRG